MKLLCSERKLRKPGGGMQKKAEKKYVFCFKFTILFFLLISQFCLSQKNNTRKLKILFVTNKFPHATRAYTDNQIVGLLDKGHEVYILARSLGEFADYPLVKQYNLLERSYYFEQIEANKKMPDTLKDIDIIYCQFGNLGEYCLRLIDEKNMNARLIVCLRGGDATSVLQKDPHRYDDLFVKANLFMPVCEYFKKNIIKHGCDPEKVVVHHSTIDCTKFRYKARTKPRDGTVRFIIVATFSERKGIRYALYAIDKLRKKYPNIKLTIIGGELRKQTKETNVIRSLIKKLNLKQHVTLLGFQLHNQIVTELNHAHIFLLTSYTRDNGVKEGIPNSLMEAMATGLPVISTYHGGIPELVKDGVSGFLIPEKNDSMLAKKIVYLIEHPKCWGFMGKAGSEQVNKKHNKDREIDKLVDIFFSVLERKKSKN